MDRRPQEELYDLQTDPEEFTNQAQNPAYANQLKELSPLRDTWMQQTKAPALTGPIPDKLNRHGS